MTAEIAGPTRKDAVDQHTDETNHQNAANGKRNVAGSRNGLGTFGMGAHADSIIEGRAACHEAVKTPKSPLLTQKAHRRRAFF